MYNLIMDKFDLVLQGPIYDYTVHAINHYGQFDFIEKKLFEG